MTFEDAYFKQKILKQDSLEAFGFTTTEQGYEFRKTLIAEELEARLFIDLEGKLTGQVVDSDLDEPYDIFRSPQATGTYVGQVREAYGELLSQLADSCYENQLFSSPQANRLVQFLVKNFQTKQTILSRRNQAIYLSELMVNGMPCFFLLREKN